MREQPEILSSILRRLSEFERRVYREVLTVGFGELTTYKKIAENIGHPKSYRAVGRVLNKNPLPFIIPCHRVIRSDGVFGGYIYGRRIKKKLIELEKRIKKEFDL